jgi:hypothetical protein
MNGMTASDKAAGIPSDNNNDTKKRIKASTRLFEGVGQTWLALLIVVPAFVLIAYMLTIQHNTINQAINSTNNSVNTTRIDQLTNFYREINQSNQTMFALMTTVFGAWVGAVVAFYFGSKSLAKSQESLERAQQLQSDAIRKALSPEQKLSSMTVGQLLDENPEAKNVVKVTMQTKIKDVKEKFVHNKDLTNVLVVDANNQKPLGLLYRHDLSQDLKLDIGGQNQKDDDKQLVDLIEEIKDDFVTHGPWNRVTGIKNYAELSLSDNLQIAQAAMQTKADGPKVRGVVVDRQGMVVGIVDYTMISAVLQKE